MEYKATNMQAFESGAWVSKTPQVPCESQDVRAPVSAPETATASLANQLPVVKPMPKPIPIPSPVPELNPVFPIHNWDWPQDYTPPKAEWAQESTHTRKSMNMQKSEHMATRQEENMNMRRPSALPPVITLPENSADRCGFCVSLAMSYVPMQKWGKLYEAEEGFGRGTIFQELDLPFVGRGTINHD